MLSNYAVSMLHNIHKETSAMRPVEVVTSVERRRLWRLEEKARNVTASFAAGVTVTEVARRHDINPQHLHQWRRAAKACKLLLPLDDDLAFAEVVVSLSILCSIFRALPDNTGQRSTTKRRQTMWGKTPLTVLPGSPCTGRPELLCEVVP